MLHDFRYGLRTLIQARGWTTVIVLSLALGIGANTALFSAANGLLLRKLAVEDPDSLVRLQWTGRTHLITNHSEFGFLDGGARAAFSYDMFRQLADAARDSARLFAAAPLEDVNVIVDGRADIATARIVSGDYYRVLGVEALLGRTILPEDDAPGAPPVAVISHRFWRARLGGGTDAIGRTVRVNNVSATIVGVLPPGFTGAQRAVDTDRDVTIPLALDPLVHPDEQRLSSATYWWLPVMGRLNAGVSIAQLQQRLEPVFRHGARADVDAPGASRSGNRRSPSDEPQLQVVSASRGLYDARPDDVRSIVLIGVAAALVLLLVCANVANLLLARAAARQKDLSVRLSLGASRARLVRQLLAESLLLSSAGASLGLIVADWGRRLLPGPTYPFDGRVVLFVAGSAVATALIFGIAPALRATRLNVSATLNDQSRTIAASRTLLGRSLLVVQVAGSIVLVMGAGLFLRTIDNLKRVDPGFNPHNLMLFQISPGLNRYDEARSRSLYEQVSTRLQALPGVRGVAMSNPAPLSGWAWATDIFVRGRDYPQGAGHRVQEMTVSPAFFTVMQMPLLAGRGFADTDTAGRPRVAVINDAAAREYFAGASPLGQRIGTIPGAPSESEIEIVGVVQDAKYESLRDAAPPTMYVSTLQRHLPSAFVQVRTAGDPLAMAPAVREAVRQIDPDLPLMNVSTQSRYIDSQLARERLFARACTLFGGAALLLAGIGLFGLMSYSVARRTNEIGIRMALGARGEDVRRLVLKESMRPVLVGVLVGLGGATATGRVVANLLFGVTPTDALTMVAAVVTLLAVALVAASFPARRAARVDPLVALRNE